MDKVLRSVGGQDVYVGGFSHGASEELLMQEVYENGPVAISVNTDAVLAATTLMVVCLTEHYVSRFELYITHH